MSEPTKLTKQDAERLLKTEPRVETRDEVCSNPFNAIPCALDGKFLNDALNEGHKIASASEDWFRQKLSLPPQQQSIKQGQTR